VPITRSPETAATLIGCLAILIWGTLALLTDFARAIPAFQLVAMAFAVGTIPGLVTMGRAGTSPRALGSVPPGAWLLGVGGLFGYHFFYFTALRHAPAVEANLINYLWPLLIVLFSALLPGHRLHWWHIAGATIGLGGALLLVTGGSGLSFQRAYLGGYLSALTCAVVWSAYSVANRRFARVPTTAVTGFCAATALLAMLCHLALEETVRPTGTTWLVVLAIGLGPIGLAFYVWDFGTKHGDIRVLGALSYGGPLLSTLLLVAFNRAEPRGTIWIACLLIVTGALLASGRLVGRRGNRHPGLPKERRNPGRVGGQDLGIEQRALDDESLAEAEDGGGERLRVGGGIGEPVRLAGHHQRHDPLANVRNADPQRIQQLGIANRLGPHQQGNTED